MHTFILYIKLNQILIRLLKSNIVLAFSILFILLNTILIAFDFYYLLLLPLVLIVIYFALYNFEYLMWFIVFSTPISLNLEELDIGGIGMYLPTEPLMFGIMIIFFLKVFYDRTFDKRILTHPMSYTIYFYLAWLCITTITSEMPIVSLKFIVSRLWFIICWYFIGTQLFRNINNYRVFFWSYLIPFSIIIVYASILLIQANFYEKAAHSAMNPFYKDHTSYGAVLAMYLPIIFIFLDKFEKRNIRVISSIVLIIVTTGTIFSYTRAAWVSLVAAFVLFLIYKFKIKFKTLAIISGIGLMIILLNWDSIFNILEKNNQDSSSDLTAHVESISNISTDASNKERINRWNSALKMFQVHPIFGWGPGTYVFQYAPFQERKDKTIISTNIGSNGNAHSEYIGPLAETGLIGSFSVILMFSMIFYFGSNLYHKLPQGKLKTIVVCTLLGIFTYVIHGFLNNYLDTDKAGVPFWGFIGLLVAIDVYHKDNAIKEETKLHSK